MSVARPLAYIGPDSAKPPKPTRKAPTKRRAKMSLVQQVAIGSGAIGIGALCLSVVDCTSSLNQLTGVSRGLAALLAILIDGGMVASEAGELAAVQSKKAREAIVWARAYMAMAVGMSVALNAYAFGQASQIGYAIGAMIPIMILCLFRMAGKLWIAGK